VLLCFGCTPYYNTTEVNYLELSSINSEKQDLNDFVNKRIDFTGLINIEYKKYKIKGNIKICNINHFQVQVISKTLGIEIIIADFFNDSLIFIDKINKKYFIGKTDNFKTLSGSNFCSNDTMKISFGRVLLPTNEYNCNSIDVKCSYNFNNLKGEIIYNNLGYLSQHSIISNNFLLNFNFDKYLKRSNIPEDIICSIKQETNFIKFGLNIVNVKTQKIELNRLNIPNNFEEY